MSKTFVLRHFLYFVDTAEFQVEIQSLSIQEQNLPKSNGFPLLLAPIIYFLLVPLFTAVSKKARPWDRRENRILKCTAFSHVTETSNKAQVYKIYKWV